jgi:acetyl esterase/lipase
MKKVISVFLAIVMVLSVSGGQVSGLIGIKALASTVSSVTQTSTDGRVQIKDGSLFVPEGAPVSYFTKQSFSGNYTIEIKTTVHHQAVGLLFGAGSPNPPLWILALVSPLGLWAHMPGDWTTINKVSSDYVKQDIPIIMKININGGTVKSYLNGNLINTCTMSAVNTSGPIGLRFADTESADVDYIKVTQNGQIIWNDDFNTLDANKWNFPVENDVDLTNINYVDGSSLSSQTLDIQLPTSGQGPYPVVMYIHGGAWVIGDKTSTETRGVLNAALNAGYAVVSINYRLAQNAKWPAQIYDCKAAIRYLRANATTYNFDPDKIAVLGASAGAHLAQFMGVTNGNSKFEDLAMGNADYSSDVQAVISYYGISDLTTWNMPAWITGITTTGKDAITTLLGDGYTRQQALDASPISYVSKNTVPFLIAHGMNDNVVNTDESTILADKLIKAIGFNLVDTYFPAVAQHADEAFWNSAEPVKMVLNFLQKRFKPTVNLDSPENTRPSYASVDISHYTNKYLNLSYANTSTNGTQKLHIILPDTGTGPFPLVIFVHGGGFSGGNSTGSSVIFTAEGALLALKKGYAVAIVDYRTANEAYFPQPIFDVKAAIRFLRKNAKTYKLDPYNFAIWGESAGGLIADFVGTTNNDPAYEDLSMGNPDTSSAVQAVVSLYAITDMTTARNAQYCQNWLGFSQSSNINVTKDASPINHVTSDDPPVYLMHGEADNEVDYQDSVNLYNKLVEKTKNPNTKLQLYPGITHAVKIFISQQNVDQITTWLDTVLVNQVPDSTELSSAVASARALDLNGYLPIGKSDFLSALAQAQLVLAKDVLSENEINAALSSLTSATSNLKLKADISPINVVLEKVQNVELSLYTADSVADYNKALIVVTNLKADATLSSSDNPKIITAVAALEAAFNGLALILKADKSPINSVLEKVQNVELSLYTADSVADYSKALIVVTDLKADTTLSSSDNEKIIVAAAALEAAYNGLKLKEKTINKSNLITIIEQVASIDLTIYTNESVVAFNAAKANAYTIINGENANQNDVDTAVQKLQKAMNDLTRKAVATSSNIVQNNDAKNIDVKSPNTGESVPITVAFSVLIFAGVLMLEGIYSFRRRFNKH